MKKLYMKIFSLVIAIAITCSMFAGCSSKENNQNTSETSTQTQSGETSGLPIVKEPLTLTYWCPLDPNQVASGIKNMSESIPYIEAEKKTGIKINFIHATSENTSEQFNLMIASNDWPDLIQWDWTKFKGRGPEFAIEDKIIIKLNDLISKYAPNYNKFLKSKPELEKMVKTDDGTHYVIPGVFTESPEGQKHVGPTERNLVYETFLGLVIREDWLKDVGLSIPSTIDEWYTVLKAFKDKKNASVPLAFSLDFLKQSGAFIGAYGVTAGIYEDDSKKVQYGPMKPEYKKFLTTFNKWYKEGLIDPEFISTNSKIIDSQVTGDKAGAWIGYPGGGVGNYMLSMSAKNPNFSVTGVTNPTLVKGEKSKFGQKDNPFKSGASVAITTKNKHPIESVKFLDFGYSDEGDMLYNWGTQGLSYDMENGQPKLKDVITNNPQGLSMVQALMKYVHYNGSIAMDYANRKEMWKAYKTPKVNEAVNAWKKPEKSVNLPPVSMKAEESEEYTKIMTDVNKYAHEMFLNFVRGDEPIQNFDKFTDKLKTMGIDKAISIQQQALDRYYKR